MEEKRWHVGTLVYSSGGLIALFAWLLGGDFTMQLRDRFIGPAAQVLLRKFGGSDFVVGVLLGTLPPIIGMILGPTVSYWSDRHRSRLGRRIPFILFATPFAVLAMLGLAMTGVLGGWLHGLFRVSLSVCMIGVFAVFWTMFDVAAAVSGAVHGALVNDVVPRPLLGRFWGFFRVLSLSAGMLFLFFFLGMVDQHYSAMFVIMGAIFGVAFTLMCLKVKEGQYPPPPPRSAHQGIFRLWQGILTYTRECFSNPYYVWFFISFTLANLAFMPINLFSLYYSQSVKMSLSTFGKFGALQLLLSMIQAPIIGWLCDKFHPLRVTIAAAAIYAVVTFVAFFYVRTWATFAVAYVGTGTCAGIWLTATLPLGCVLLPQHKFATMSSAGSIFGAMGTIIGAPIIGRWLDYVNGNRAPAMRDYHDIYIWAAIFMSLSLLTNLVVLTYFKKYGGTQNYVAPE